MRTPRGELARQCRMKTRLREDATEGEPAKAPCEDGRASEASSKEGEPSEASSRRRVCRVGNSWIQFARGTLDALASGARWVYVALMDATLASIGEWTASGGRKPLLRHALRCRPLGHKSPRLALRRFSCARRPEGRFFIAEIRCCHETSSSFFLLRRAGPVGRCGERDRRPPSPPIARAGSRSRRAIMSPAPAARRRSCSAAPTNAGATGRPACASSASTARRPSTSMSTG